MEICINGAYGTVCDDGFDDTDANVICGELGYDDTGELNFLNIQSCYPEN